MAIANRTWGEERIAAELRLKLGITVSPRTVRRYMPRRGPSRGGSQSRSSRTSLRNHAGEVLACDFFVAVAAALRRVYVFVVLDVGRERLDWVISLNERHLRRILAAWVHHDNRGRPHAAFGPGVPAPLTGKVFVTGHDVSHGCRVAVHSVLGGPHHDRLEPLAA